MLTLEEQDELDGYRARLLLLDAVLYDTRPGWRDFPHTKGSPPGGWCVVWAGTTHFRFHCPLSSFWDTELEAARAVFEAIKNSTAIDWLEAREHGWKQVQR